MLRQMMKMMKKGLGIIKFEEMLEVDRVEEGLYEMLGDVLEAIEDKEVRRTSVTVMGSGTGKLQMKTKLLN